MRSGLYEDYVKAINYFPQNVSMYVVFFEGRGEGAHADSWGT